MKSDRIVKGVFATEMATGQAGMVNSMVLMAVLFVFMAVSSTKAQTIRFTFPTTRVTVPVNYSNVVTIPINNTANTNGLGVSTNGLTSWDTNNPGYFHLDPINLNVSGLPPGVTYNITSPDGVVLTQIGNASTNTGHLGYETNNYHTNLLVNLFCTNVPQGVYTFYLNAGGNGDSTPGLPTNSMPLILQAAHIWAGNGPAEASFGVSNNWANASSWLGGAPAAGDDTVFGDIGAQTNNSFITGASFTNIGVSSTLTVASMRFSPTVYTNTASTNALTHTIQIGPGATLFVTGTNGFSLLRDYIGNAFGQLNDRPDRPMFITIGGTNAVLLVSNTAAAFNVLHSIANAQVSTLNLTNLDRLVFYGSRIGLAEYQLQPNYLGLNQGYNGDALVTNDYTPRPGALGANIYLARTNTIIASYKDPNNYADENRTYAFSYENSEQAGLGGSPSTSLLLGTTNRFMLDSICIGRANHQAVLSFWSPNSGATFRSTNFAVGNTFTNYANHDATNRMSVFTISDDGGSTNMANSNVKATIDFAANNGFVDILADRLYIARDRTLISSNQTPNVQGTLLIGNGNVDVNTAVLGFQEHTNKMDWQAFNPTYQPYLNYCEGRVTVTNGGTFRVNKTLTLGYTADTNPSSSAQQYNTWGQISVFTGSTLAASNIVCDGGLNFYDPNKRLNSITVQGGTLIISNSIGAIAGLPAYDPRGLPLDTLTLNQGTLIMPVTAGKTNIFVRTLSNPGSIPSVIKITSVSGVSSYPATIPIISYETATPFMAADVSAVGGGVQGYLLNDSANKLINLFLTTNAPKALTWVGGAPAGPTFWDTVTTNWIPVGGGAPTNFSLGDIVTFDDSSTITNINITALVVPNQTAANTGVTVTNMTRQYTFNFAGGAVGGTAKLLKAGTNNLVVNATITGPMTIQSGTVTGSGALGSVTLNTNTVLDYSGAINGSLISTGMVTLEASGSLKGSVTVGGGALINHGTIDDRAAGGLFTVTNAVVTNAFDGFIYLGNGNAYELFPGTVLANFGNIQANDGGVLNIDGLCFGTGLYYGVSGGLAATQARFQIKSFPAALLSPGATPQNSIGSMYLGARVDLSQSGPVNQAGTLLVEIDATGGPGGSSTNDTFWADRWNNVGNIWVMTNINGGTFSSGQIFHVFRNNADGGSGTFFNFVDSTMNWPLVYPIVPKAGLQWNLSRLQNYGDIMVTNCTMIWDGSGNGSWDTNGSVNNWKSGKVYADFQGAVFDDSASGTTTITVTGTNAPVGFNFVTVTNLTSTNFFTNFPAFSPAIVVSNAVKDYVFVGNSIAGIAGLYKTGAGTLTVLTTNSTYQGGVVVDNGVFAFTNVNAFGQQNATGGGQGGGKSAYSQVIVDNNATLRNFGSTNQSLPLTMTINQFGATVEVSNSTTLFSIANIVGQGALTKTGPGTLILTSSGNAFAGNLNINQSIVQMNGQNAGFGDIVMANGTTLQLTNAGNLTLTNKINVAANSATIMQLGSTPKVIYDNGRLTGSGLVTISNGPVTSFVFNGILTNFTGTLSFGNSAGNCMFNSGTNKNPCLGSAFATFDLGTGSATLSNFNGGALTYDLGGLAGGANTVVAGRMTNNIFTNATCTYSIGANGSNTVFAGAIKDGFDVASVVSVVKVGTGSLLLNGASTYTGGTTVSNGILGGTGSIAGALTLTANGTLSPGAPIGTFTVGGAANLAGKVLLELNRTAPATNDQLSVAGTITATGTLIVTNVGPGLFSGKYQLFNKGVTGFTVTLPAKDPTATTNYNWSNDIALNGSITLLNGLPVGPSTAPFVITNSYSSVDGKLTLTWPQDHTGFRLLSNSVSLTETSMWFQVFNNAENTNKVILNIDPAKTNVFFRLTYP